jgi:uncharacterized membrane protein
MEPPEVLSYPITASQQSEAEPSVILRLRCDRALQILLALTLLANLALLVYLVIRYEALPDPLPLHFDASGLPDRIEAKNGIFALPAIGFIVLVLNTALGILIHRHERAATRLLVAGAMLIQVLLWLAAINIAGGLF